MSETPAEPTTQTPDITETPSLTHAAVASYGLTLLATGGTSPALDVFFVHGLQGDPKDTWLFKGKSNGRNDDGTPKRKLWNRRKKGKQTNSSASTSGIAASDDGDCYWPADLLARDLPTARIYTYGYDSSISHFFNGPANQSTITDNGRALLTSIASSRRDCCARPLLLIVHSLGGIVVKSVRPRTTSYKPANYHELIHTKGSIPCFLCRRER